jgi:hypothetical protein
METSAGFGTSRLFLSDSRLVLAVLNHLRYQALNRAFGASRGQANVLTVVLLLGAADGAYGAARRISGSLRVSGTNAALGTIGLREAALGVAGPRGREVSGFGTLIAFAMLGGLAAPGLRRTAMSMRATEQRLRAAEGRVRRERILRYAAARDRGQANPA